MSPDASTVTLVGADYSVYTRIVRIGLKEKRVSHAFQEIDIFDETEKQRHRSLHPFGKIPVLLYGSETIIESAAILRFLEVRHPDPHLFPVGPPDLAIAEQTIEVVQSYAYPVLVWKVYVPWSKVPVADRAGLDFSAIEPDVDACLNFLNSGLTGRDFFAGNQFGAADAYVYPVLCCFRQVPWAQAKLARLEALRLWIERVAKRQSVLETRFPLEIEQKP